MKTIIGSYVSALVMWRPYRHKDQQCLKRECEREKTDFKCHCRGRTFFSNSYSMTRLCLSSWLFDLCTDGLVKRQKVWLSTYTRSQVSNIFMRNERGISCLKMIQPYLQIQRTCCTISLQNLTECVTGRWELRDNTESDEMKYRWDLGDVEIILNDARLK